jgi:hypothetical protein
MFALQDTVTIPGTAPNYPLVSGLSGKPAAGVLNWDLWHRIVKRL